MRPTLTAIAHDANQPLANVIPSERAAWTGRADFGRDQGASESKANAFEKLKLQQKRTTNNYRICSAFATSSSPSTISARSLPFTMEP